MVRRQTWQARRFEIFESARHFRIESNREVQFESNIEASQVPNYTPSVSRVAILPYLRRTCRYTRSLVQVIQVGRNRSDIFLPAIRLYTVW